MTGSLAKKDSGGNMSGGDYDDCRAQCTFAMIFSIQHQHIPFSFTEFGNSITEKTARLAGKFL